MNKRNSLTLHRGNGVVSPFLLMKTIVHMFIVYTDIGARFPITYKKYVI